MRTLVATRELICENMCALRRDRVATSAASHWLSFMISETIAEISCCRTDLSERAISHDFSQRKRAARTTDKEDDMREA